MRHYQWFIAAGVVLLLGIGVTWYALQPITLESEIQTALQEDDGRTAQLLNEHLLNGAEAHATSRDGEEAASQAMEQIANPSQSEDSDKPLAPTQEDGTQLAGEELPYNGEWIERERYRARYLPNGLIEFNINGDSFTIRQNHDTVIFLKDGSYRIVREGEPYVEETYELTKDGVTRVIDVELGRWLKEEFSTLNMLAVEASNETIRQHYQQLYAELLGEYGSLSSSRHVSSVSKTNGPSSYHPPLVPTR